jgi:hypothetical protein
LNGRLNFEAAVDQRQQELGFDFGMVRKRSPAGERASDRLSRRFVVTFTFSTYQIVLEQAAFSFISNID